MCQFASALTSIVLSTSLHGAHAWPYHHCAKDADGPHAAEGCPAYFNQVFSD